MNHAWVCERAIQHALHGALIRDGNHLLELHVHLLNIVGGRVEDLRLGHGHAITCWQTLHAAKIKGETVVSLFDFGVREHLMHRNRDHIADEADEHVQVRAVVVR